MGRLTAKFWENITQKSYAKQFVECTNTVKRDYGAKVMNKLNMEIS